MFTPPPSNAVWHVPRMVDRTVAKVGTVIQLSGGAGPDGLVVDEDGSLAVAHIILSVVWIFSARGEPLHRESAGAAGQPGAGAGRKSARGAGRAAGDLRADLSACATPRGTRIRAPRTSGMLSECGINC